MSALPIGIERAVPLSRFTTIGTGGPAAYLGLPGDEDALLAMLRWAREAGQTIAVIGLGSNLLPADAGFDGLVLRLEDDLARIEVDETGATVGGGAALAAVVRKVGDAGLGGFEFACAIPGTMGGAVRMNAGAYGRELSDVLVEATICSADGVRRAAAADLGLRYRHSDLVAGEIVTAARIALAADDPTAIRERVREYQGRRSAAQPRKARTFGSVFKNPDGDRTSGQILEACGLKGYTVGGARISEKHANFIENVDGATSADVVALMAEARRRAREQFGVELEHEVQTLGDIAIPPV
ncbi:MAG: UDP-N-acetylmuramate dehydrogenase [Gaiellales bacterium]